VRLRIGYRSQGDNSKVIVLLGLEIQRFCNEEKVEEKKRKQDKEKKCRSIYIGIAKLLGGLGND
jgi:hypothetical protein